jgi:hypothetical protein
MSIHADGIEQDVDPSRPPVHIVDVVLDGSLVARIHACHLDRPASVGDLLGHPFFDRGLGSAGEEDVGPFPGERTSHRLADRPTP